MVAAAPGGADIRSVRLPAGSRVADALVAAGVRAGPKIGIFGRLVALDAPLAEGDRIELYRELLVDPKEARRRRARKGG